MTLVTLPNGQSVTVTYQNNFLHQLTLPMGIQWTCTLSTDPVSQTTSIQVNSPIHGVRTYKVCQDFMTYNNAIVSQPTNCFRGIVDTNNQNILSIFPNPANGNQYRVWYYNNMLTLLNKGYYEAAYSTWTLSNPSAGYAGFTNLTLEPTYAEKLFPPAVPGASYTNDDLPKMLMCGASPNIYLPSSIKGNPPITCAYDSDYFLTRIDFPDGTYETFSYNGFKQVLRHRNRMACVTICEYDIGGNLLKRKVGIKEISGSDVNQPEYAEYRWEYYADGNLKTEFSPLNSGQADIHRTDYSYYSNGELMQILDSADVTGGPRKTTKFTYTSLGNVTTTEVFASNAPTNSHFTDLQYDVIGRQTVVTYHGGATEAATYGTPFTADALRMIKRKNRGDVVTTMTFDSIGRVTTQVEGAEKIVNGSPQVITDPTQKRTTTIAYLGTSPHVISQTTDGKYVSYIYDFKLRGIETNRFANASKILTSKLNYVNNRVFYTEDPYGRREYMGYSAANAPSLIRRVQCNHPGYTLVDNTAVINLVRSTVPNAAFTIADAIKDANGNLIEVIDGRTISTKYTHDSRDREIRRKDAFGTAVEATSETDYDKASNVVESRSPRYFDTNDSQTAYMKTLFVYNGRNMPSGHTAAPGSNIAATTSQTYTYDGKPATSTDANGKLWTTDYDDGCCELYVGRKDPLGHGSIANTDSMHRTVHTAVVQDFTTHTTKLNPVDNKTFGESTSKFDNLGRAVAQTQWLTAQGLIDRDNPPIAGLGGIPVANGNTSQTFYDSNMADGIGFDSAGGIAIQKLGGGTYSLSLTAVLSKAAAAEASGGANTSFTANSSSGSAVVSINPMEEISVSISDATGRGVISAQLQPWNGPQPFALISWSCSVYDQLPTISGFGVCP